MTVRSWIGVVLALVVFALFGLYISKHEITAVAGFVFGGGLLFAGMLIDPAEFKSLLALIRNNPAPPMVLAFFLLAAAPAGAQSPLRVDPINQPSLERHHFQAETSCAGADSLLHPGGTAQLRHLTAEEQAETGIHEAVHRRQLAVGCDSIMADWDTNFVARVEAEAEAFCEGMKAGNVPQSWWHARSVRAAAWWARFTTIGYDRAIAAFDRYCQE